MNKKVNQGRIGRRTSSSFSRCFKRIQRAHSLAEHTGAPVDEALDAIKKNKVSELGGARRQFLKNVGMGVAAASSFAPAAAMAQSVKTGAKDPGRVAIIGGGLAGLRCAHKLWNMGYASNVFEASSRLGGRARTKSGFFEFADQVNLGGEFISSEHEAILRLCERLGVEVEDVNGGANFDGEELYSSNGAFVTEADLNDAWQTLRPFFRRAKRAAPYQPIYNDFNDEHRRLDLLNVPGWLDEIGLGANSPIGGIFQSDCISEYGIAPELQPALNLIYTLAYNPPETALPLAGTDEQFRIVGGSERLVHALASKLPEGTIHKRKALVAVYGSAQGPYSCYFDDGTCYHADQLVLALPFTTLRNVDFSNAIWESFIPEKRDAIQRLCLGTNAKLHIETSSRPWQQTRNINGQSIMTNAVSYSDENSFVTVWDAETTSNSTGTVYTDLLGGQQGIDVQTRRRRPFARARRSVVNKFIHQVEPVFPGTAAAYTGRAHLAKWVDKRWIRGSYTTPAVGDYTSIWGAQWQKEAGNKVFFAGEHISEECWGFMNGSIETGTIAAKQLVMLADL